MSCIPLMVTVGISGHRKKSQMSDTLRIKDIIKQRFLDLKGKFNVSCGIDFLLVSPLADGADRLFVDAIWEVEPEARLMVPMPSARETYEKDFDDQSKAAFARYLNDPRCIETIELPFNGEERYLEVGKFVVDHSDFMFFVHDGEFASEFDGGTASIYSYATFCFSQCAAKKGEACLDPNNRSPYEKKSFCYIHSLDLTSYWSFEKEGGAIIADDFADYLLGLDLAVNDDMSFADFKSSIENFNNKYFSDSSVKSQVKFGRGSFLIIIFAFMLGLFNIIDLSFPDFIFNNNFKTFNWTLMEFIGFSCLILIVLFIKRAGHLEKWLFRRYLAEHLRHTPEYCLLEVPVSQVINSYGNDPAPEGLIKIWHSLYYHILKSYKDKGYPRPTLQELRDYLVRSDDAGFVSSQLLWHKKKLLLKYAVEGRYVFAKYFLLILGMFLVTFSAINLTIYGTESAKIWNLVCGIESLLLAAVVAIANIKEHGKIAVQYTHACRRFEQIYRRMRFCNNHEQLSGLFIDATDTLMDTTYDWMRTMETKNPDAAG